MFHTTMTNFVYAYRSDKPTEIPLGPSHLRVCRLCSSPLLHYEYSVKIVGVGAVPVSHDDMLCFLRKFHMYRYMIYSPERGRGIDL
jgi:hypothetical protein